ncbi:FAD binding domain-containing protein [Candidatus Hakubella thermalkaliphila]|uniref:Aerobic carbon-monoxide dehydrogenase medium subunit n=2 Tax=Candidatus Hakubella thermalkaliphila TaxID=2754717 RepID=A0A6V8Q2Q8_9ACTN|nr:xanthine dehydrogenase family protein subunit M [Candidatus Hakubella thermalkaliphila]GFP39052.1 aerobic carbon-monoxide dehydrogenase medium subunit [Candidatus Hakubella thermalkaliphila]
MKNFEYHRPSSFKEALALWEKLGEGCLYLNGGTDVVVRIKEKLEQPDHLIDLKGIPELKKIYQTEEGLFIGGGVTLKEVASFLEVGKNYPGLKEAASSIGAHQIQVRETLAGNLASSVPSADTAPILLCYEAELLAQGPAGERRLKITTFFRRPRLNSLEPGEILKEIFVPRPTYPHASIYIKLGRRAALDLPIVGAAALVLDPPSGFEYRVALGAVAPTPVRTRRLEEFLCHKVLTRELLDQALPLVLEDVAPIDDVRASREYRLEMCLVLTRRALYSTWENLLLSTELVV